jgi:hypothetical protein
MSYRNSGSAQWQGSDISDKLKGLLPRLDKYFEAELSNKKAARSKDYLPVTLAKQLKTSEAVALALLMVYENAGLVMPEYHVLCPDTYNVLRVVQSPAELPETIHCPYHDPEREHDQLEYYMDIVFRLTPQAVETYAGPDKR